MPTVVMAWPVATVVPTVDAKPHTTAGSTFSNLSFDACTIAALPIPTQIAAMAGVSDELAMASSDSDARTRPVRFEATLCTNPAEPPPTTKNDAHAMNVPQTGTGSRGAVSWGWTTATLP